MTELFNANAGLSGRDGGPYLDDVQRQEAEIRRAAVEGREPDLTNPIPGSETLLVTKEQLISIAEQRRVDPISLEVTVAPVGIVEETPVEETPVEETSVEEETPVEEEDLSDLLQ